MVIISKSNKVYSEINRCNKFSNELNDILLHLNNITLSAEEQFAGNTREAILDSLSVLKVNCSNASESVRVMKRSLNSLIGSIEEHEAREKAKEAEKGKNNE